jgi:quercetin dioxygenase-like cupin family protein
MDITFHGGDEEAGNVFAVRTDIPAGKYLCSHKHAHGHMSILASGTVKAQIGGEIKEYTGPAIVNVPKDTFHEVFAITDAVWFCLWADELVDKQKCFDSLEIA